MKYNLLNTMALAPQVAPFVGAWIEIFWTVVIGAVVIVAPFVGAWIEISVVTNDDGKTVSRSVRRSVD